MKMFFPRNREWTMVRQVGLAALSLAMALVGTEAVAQEASDAPAVDPNDVENVRVRGIDNLVYLGRDRATAECIVDALIVADAFDVIDSPDFGLGLDAREASAVAVCL